MNSIKKRKGKSTQGDGESSKKRTIDRGRRSKKRYHVRSKKKSDIKKSKLYDHQPISAGGANLDGSRSKLYDGAVVNGVANDGLLDETQKQQLRDIFTPERVKLFKSVTVKKDNRDAAGMAGLHTYYNVFLCSINRSYMIFNHFEEYLGSCNSNNVTNYELSVHQPDPSGSMQGQLLL